MPLINCEVNITLTCSANCARVSNTAADQATIFAITDKEFYVQVVTLSSQHTAKLLQQLKSGSKRIINWNKYQSKVTMQRAKVVFRLLN